MQVSGTWSSFSIGANSTCAIKSSDSSLWCWGYNSSGQVGDGTTTTRTSPVQIGTSAWSSVHVGGAIACGIRTAGTAWCWGNNSSQQTGTNSVTSNRITSPTQLTTSTLLAGTAWVDIRPTAAGVSTCGLRNDATNGSLYCWASNSYGSVGDPNFGKYFTPVGG